MESLLALSLVQHVEKQRQDPLTGTYSHGKRRLRVGIFHGFLAFILLKDTQPVGVPCWRCRAIRGAARGVARLRLGRPTAFRLYRFPTTTHTIFWVVWPIPKVWRPILSSENAQHVLLEVPATSGEAHVALSAGLASFLQQLPRQQLYGMWPGAGHRPLESSAEV